MDPLRRRGTSRPVVLIPSHCPAKSTASTMSQPELISRNSTPKRTANATAPGSKLSSPITKTVIEDSKAGDSAEEEIVTAGARATLNNAPAWPTVATRPNISFETHHLPGDPSSEDEWLESESDSEQSEMPSEQSQDAKPRHVGFPPVEELPDWFPENIKQIYRVDRHGGALSYKELNEITRYRAALEIIYRRRWKAYNKAGDARWKLQQVLHKLKRRPLTAPFYKYRKEQFREWKSKALKLWKCLEKTHRGILILESTININFRQERMIHEKHLKGKPL